MAIPGHSYQSRLIPRHPLRGRLGQEQGKGKGKGKGESGGDVGLGVGNGLPAAVGMVGFGAVRNYLRTAPSSFTGSFGF